MKPLAASNTSFLSLMHELGYLRTCKALFERIIVLRAVYEEISSSQREELIKAVEELMAEGFIEVAQVSNRALVAVLRERLGAGESEVIALAVERPDIDFVILDDLKARKVFRRLSVGKKLIGSIGVLKKLLREELITISLEELTLRLREAGFYFEEKLLRDP